MVNVIRTAPRLHPLVAAAAISVIAVSAAGIGVMTGVIPGSHAGGPTPTATASSAPAVVAQAAPVPVTPVVTLPEPAAPVVVADQPAPRVAPKPHAVRVASADSRRDKPVQDRANTLPAVSGNPVHHEAADVYATGNPGTPYGASSAGYGSAPIQVAQAPVAKPACANCGVVESVIETEKPGEGTGIGVAGGAIGGAVLGKQFGNGGGRDALTILGAIGGALAGHQVEKKVRATKVYEVRVRMEDGSIRTVSQATPPSWRNGDRVRVDGGNISLDS